MVSSRFMFIFSSNTLLLVITRALAQPAPFLNRICSKDQGNYTTNSTYRRNLNTLLTSLPGSENSTGYGFYYSSYGQDPNRVYAIGLCRGDIATDDCRSCLNDSRVGLSEFCPNQKEAIGWKDNCMLRYSNRSIYGIMETTPDLILINTQNVSSSLEEVFLQQLEKLLESLTSQAASAGPLRKFAIGNTSTGGAFQNIYALTQCTPDLSEQECSDCLGGAIGQFTLCCSGKIGGRLITPSCYFRYEITTFIDPADVVPLPSPISPPQPSTNTNPTGSKGNKSRTVIIVVVSIGVSLMVLIISICICLRVRKTVKEPERKLVPDEDVDEIQSSEALQFDFDIIKNATDNFSEANKLGEGGFGSVYKGQLPSGEVIAVKRLSLNSGQGNLEFKNEVLLVAKLQHRNLVRLLGFCLEGNEKVLVYEFVPNTSLDHIIFDPIKRAQLDWDGRYKIIVGIARGLLYLHEDSRLRIIHRDLKVSNILIDAELNPKIADFGMARLFVPDQTQGNTSRIVGTYGYMAPEYAMHGQFSVKSDVYSFGVLVLEIITGQKNSCFRHGEKVEDLLSYAWKCWSEGTAPNLIDPTLRNGSRSEIMRCIHIGLLCVQENIVDRPTMTSISVMLNSYSLALPLPSPPNFFMTSRTDPLAKDYTATATDESDQLKSSSSLINCSVNENITEIYPR